MALIAELNADFTRERLEFYKLLIDAHAQRDSAQEQERECSSDSHRSLLLIHLREFVLLIKQNITPNECHAELQASSGGRPDRISSTKTDLRALIHDVY